MRRLAPAAILAACTAGGDSGGPDTAETCDALALDWGPGGGAMLPGTDCIGCHRDGGSAQDTPYTLAGTVLASPTCPQPVEGATVRATDGTGLTVELVTNEAGNFYTDAPIAWPAAVEVEVGGVVTAMDSPAPSGACGFCHAEGSALGFVAGG